MEILDAVNRSRCMHCGTEWRYLVRHENDSFRIPCGHGGGLVGFATQLPTELLALALLLLEE